MPDQPYTRRAAVRKTNGKYEQSAREEMAAMFNGAPDGFYEVTIQEDKKRYTTTRYKFYFGHVVETILLTVGSKFKVMLENGTWRPVNSPEEMHRVLKRMYNPVTYVTPDGQTWTEGASTTELNDRDFVWEYIESIMADFSLPPYNCEFLTREEWREVMKQERERKIIPAGK